VNPHIVLAGAIVGLLVGMTGAGGGALMTPILVLLFGVTPSAAVSSDIVASAIMKPFGGLIHFRRGTVHTGLVLWLSVGSVPAAFAGVFVDHALGSGDALQTNIEYAMGAALVLAAGGMTLRMFTKSGRADLPDDTPIPVRRVPTVVIGAAGGLLVGATSVGSGSLMLVLLMLAYPQLSMRRLIGTDIVQSMPLVGSAALAHVLFGSLEFGLTAAIAVGSIPAVIVGSLLSSRAPGGVLRPILAVVLFATAIKLLGVSAVGVAISAAAMTAFLAGAALLTRRDPRSVSTGRACPGDDPRTPGSVHPGDDPRTPGSVHPGDDPRTPGNVRISARSSSSPSRRGDTAA
jgi:uncharacterized membrane protein YfcA